MNALADLNLANSLKELYQSDNAAKALFDWFGSRVRGASEIEVEHASTKTGVEYSKVIKVFRKLHDLGCGKFMEGRRGFKSRITFTYGIIGLGNVARGSNVQALVPVEKQLPDDLDDDVNASSVSNSVLHPYQLRSDFLAELRLPNNLSEKEAERLAAFIKTLPF